MTLLKDTCLSAELSKAANKTAVAQTFLTGAGVPHAANAQLYTKAEVDAALSNTPNILNSIGQAFTPGTEVYSTAEVDAAIAAIPTGHTVTYGLTTTPPAGATTGQVYHQTTTGTAAGTLQSIWVYDGAAWFNQAMCPAPMTRAALLALRTAGTLNPACHYTITDFVQGQFLAGTRITMHADSATELSMDATINSLYDNSGWSCRYDIDTNNLTMVADNLDNIVESTVVGRVATFDWGNPAYSGNRMQGQLLKTFGATQPFIGNTITRFATVDVTGRTGGSITDTHIKGQLALANSNLTVSRSNIDTNSSITATGYTAGGTGVVNSRLSGTSGIVIGPNSGAVNFTNLDMVNGNGTAINHTGTGTCSITNSQIENAASITHSSTGLMNIGGCKIHGGSTTIVHSTGPGGLVIVSSELGPYARVLKDDPASTGVTTISYCRIDASGYIFARGANTLSVSYSNITTAAGVITRSGSNTLTEVFYCNFNSGPNASVDITATATAGAFRMEYTQCSNNGFVTKSGTGNTIISQSLFQGAGRVVHAGARNLTVTSSTFSDRAIFTHNSPTTGGSPDSVNNCNFRSGAGVNMTATGLNANQLNLCELSQNSPLAIGGTTTGAVLTTLNLSGQSSATFNNNADMPLCISNNIGPNGALTVTDNTASKDIRYNTVRNSSTLSITGNTVAANVHSNALYAYGQLLLTAAAGSTRFNEVSRGGILSTSGGAVEYNMKALASTWNTSVFNTTQCINEVNSVVTLTADNSLRSTRIGVTNTVPLI